jgi:hypothetical protein
VTGKENVLNHGARTALIYGVVALSATAAPWAAIADSASADCDLPPMPAHPLMDRDGGLSQYIKLPEHCLKTMYMYCSAASEKVILDQGPMMACSLGHEALLRRVFGGDFNAMLAWWRSQREPMPRD